MSTPYLRTKREIIQFLTAGSRQSEAYPKKRDTR